MPLMAEPERAARELAEGLLEHPIAVALVADGGRPLVAGSVAGDPPRARVAWIDPAGPGIVARVACPPGRPSRWRPVVATTVRLNAPGDQHDRVLAARLAPEAVALRPLLAAEGEEPVVAPGDDGLVLVRLPDEGALVAVDALDAHLEPVGRLVRAGISDLQTDGGTVSGRLGATHGMGAGIGHGRWAAGLPEAAFEAGYEPWLPAWMPPGMAMGDPRIEPDVSYPAAPPALIVAWTGEAGERVLLRQAPAPLASPDSGGRGAREVDVGGAAGVLRGRGLVTLIWETPERAFGVQVRGMAGGEETALRVARSVSPENLGPPAEPG